MDNILFVNGRLRKYVKQVCRCENSQPVGRIIFGTTEWNNEDQFDILLKLHADVCNKCAIPYKVWIDTSNCVLVKNVGD